MYNNRELLVIYTERGKRQLMEDKRITKTKKCLKNTLIRMLDKEDFEHISITDLCREADISRITFYSHYGDKYALVNEIFNDMLEIGKEKYYRRQSENNPKKHLVTGYVNILNSILDVYYERYDFFRHTDPEKNPYLASRLCSIILEMVELHTDHLQRRLKLKYSPKRIAGFMCFGLLGFVNESHEEKIPLDKIREEAEQLLTDVLRSGVVTEEGKGEK